MIKLRYEKGFSPRYMTAMAAAADLYAREGCLVQPGERVKIPTGVWIDSIDFDKVPNGQVPELQIRCRSGLAFKKGLTLSNGIGTVDADYRDEICVLLTNSGSEPQQINIGDRIAQVALSTVSRIPDLDVGDQRFGGFGSTDREPSSLEN